MAIAPSKLGRFVLSEGFTWPRSAAASSQDCAVADRALARRLRQAGLVRCWLPRAVIAWTFRAARAEHISGGYSSFNSPQERVRVFLWPCLTRKGRRWAVPLKSLEIPDDVPGARPWWKVWAR